MTSPSHPWKEKNSSQTCLLGRRMRVHQRIINLDTSKKKRMRATTNWFIHLPNIFVGFYVSQKHQQKTNRYCVFSISRIPQRRIQFKLKFCKKKSSKHFSRVSLDSTGMRKKIIITQQFHIFYTDNFPKSKYNYCHKKQKVQPRLMVYTGR
jgi:hypothetical protein